MVISQVSTQQYKIRELLGYKYLEEGEGQVIVLLHGLFGNLSNWGNVIEHFSENYKVIVPLLPVY